MSQNNETNTQITENNNTNAESDVTVTVNNKEKFKNKLWYSIDLGLFLSGILLLLLYKLDTKEVEIRGFIGLSMIFASYYALPFIDKEKKEKYSMIFSWHFVVFVATFIIAYISLNIYVKNPNGAIWWKEILAALGILFVVSYISYLLINFIRAFYLLITKLISFLLNSNVESKYKNAKKIIEKITAFIVTLTAMAASITALIASLKNIT